MLLADIVHGEVDWADIMFLVGAILFGVVFILRVMAPRDSVDQILLAAGLTVVAIGWLLL